MALPIVHYNDPMLRKKGSKVTAFDADLARFAQEMIETMHAAEGIGLAAQQVGQARQVCVVDLRGSEAKYDWSLDGKAQPPKDLVMPLVVVNPKVVPVPGAPEGAYEEGCLSFPGIRGDVVRPEAVTVEFQDESGVPHTLSATGLLARCFQHEADHLAGVLFIDRMSKDVRAKIDDAVKALAKATREGRDAPAGT